MDEKFQATEGHWIGAKVGIYSLTPNPQGGAGHADFEYFRFSPRGDFEYSLQEVAAASYASVTNDNGGAAHAGK
jgi:hypothetical protein